MSIQALAALCLVAAIVGSACAPSAPTAAPASPAPAARAPGAGASSPSGATPAAAPAARQPLSVKIGVLDTLVDAPFYVADQRGYFAAQGLDVSFEKFKSGADALPAIATGQVDVAWTSYTAGMFNALTRNIKLRIVANAARTTRDGSALNLMVRHDLADSIRDFADLRGRRLSINAYGTGAEVYLIRALEQGGLAESDVTVTELGFPDAATALSTGGLDAGMLIEPLVTITASRGVADRWRNAADMYGGPHDGGIVMYAETFATAHPHAARGFLVAYLQGVRDTIKALKEKQEPLKSEVVQTLTENLAVKDAGLYDRMSIGMPDPNGRIDRDTLTAYYEFFVRRGHIPQPVDATQFIDPAYLEAALGQLGRVAE